MDDAAAKMTPTNTSPATRSRKRSAPPEEADDEDDEDYVPPSESNMGRKTNKKPRKSKDSSTANTSSTPQTKKKEKRDRDAEWHSQYQKLVAFQQEHGHTEVPQRYKDDPSFGRWVNRQRERYNSATIAPPLPAERIALLNQLAFDWNPATKRHDVWRQQYDKLVAYKQAVGHVRVPLNYEQDPALGRWFKEQKKQYSYFLGKAGKRKSQLTPNRLALLDQIHFWPDSQVPPKTTPKAKAAASKAKAAPPKQSAVSATTTATAAAAAAAVASPKPRKAHGGSKKKRAAASPKKRAAASPKKRGSAAASNRKKPPPAAANSSAKATHAATPKKKRGRPRKHQLRPAEQQQRQHLPNNIISPQRTSVKCPKTAAWLAQYEKVKAFAAQHGHTEISSNYPPDPALGRWCGRQREHYSYYTGKNLSRKSQLTAERIELLEQINFAWTISYARQRHTKSGAIAGGAAAQPITWDDRYAQLETFQQQHGHCRVTLAHDRDHAPGLLAWTFHQRYELLAQQNHGNHSNNNNMSCDDNNANGETNNTNNTDAAERERKVALLNTIGYEWTPSLPAMEPGKNPTWDDRFAQLQAFHAANGHTRVTFSYDQQHAPNLQRWTKNQRKRLPGKSGALWEQKRAALDLLGFEWTSPPPSAPPTWEEWLRVAGSGSNK